MSTGVCLESKQCRKSNIEQNDTHMDQRRCRSNIANMEWETRVQWMDANLATSATTQQL